MSALFFKNLVSSFVHFMIAFLRVLVKYGTWETLKILVSVGAYLFKASRKVFSKSHIYQLHWSFHCFLFPILSLN